MPISHWLLILTVLLALFLALSKRRHELVLLADGATGHRPILEEYSPYLLDQMIAVVTASTLVAYVIYTVSPETVQKFQHRLPGAHAASFRSTASSGTCISCIRRRGAEARRTCCSTIVPCSPAWRSGPLR